MEDMNGPAPTPPPSSRLLTAYAIPGIRQISPGDDLAVEISWAIANNRVQIKDGDILVIASKLVAKADGLIRTTADRTEFERLVTEHSIGTVAARTFHTTAGAATVAITRTPHGTVQAASGLDRSNTGTRDSTGGGSVLLQPDDPDAAAEQLLAALSDRLGAQLGIVISDSTSRPWRAGVADIAIGAAGIDVLDDQRGRPDDSGRRQGVTVRAIADEIAAAADLVKGAARGLPAAVVRGMGAHVRTGGGSARELVRDFAEDWFRYGHVEAVHRSLGCQRLDVAPASADGDDDILTKVSRALAVVRRGTARTPGQSAWRMRVAGAGGQILISPADTPARSSAGGHPLIEATLGLGALVDRLQSALWCEDLQASTQYTWADNGSPTGARLSIELATPQP